MHHNEIVVFFPVGQGNRAVLDGTIRRRTVRVSNSTWEICCNRKRTTCVFGPPLWLAIEINDVPRRSHQNVNLFAAPHGEPLRSVLGCRTDGPGPQTVRNGTQSRNFAKSKKRNLVRTVF